MIIPVSEKSIQFIKLKKIIGKNPIYNINSGLYFLNINKSFRISINNIKTIFDLHSFIYYWDNRYVLLCKKQLNNKYIEIEGNKIKDLNISIDYINESNFKFDKNFNLINLIIENKYNINIIEIYKKQIKSIIIKIKIYNEFKFVKISDDNIEILESNKPLDIVTYSKYDKYGLFIYNIKNVKENIYYDNSFSEDNKEFNELYIWQLTNNIVNKLYYKKKEI